MSRGYRYALIAIVGWLIASPVLSQESEQQQPQSQGEGSAEQRNPAPFSVPVRILENPEQSEADKRSQQEASQREIEDLAAQQGMAKGTQDIVWLNKLQLALAFAGTLALLYSIALNRRATNAAVQGNANTLQAIDQEQKNAQRQLRAYLYVSAIALGYSAPAKLQIQMTYKNFGQTPAKSVRIRHVAGVGSIVEEKMTFGGLEKQKLLNSSDIPPGHEIAINYTFDMDIPDALIKQIEDKKLAIYFWGTADYVDAFGSPQSLIFRRVTKRLPVKQVVSAIVEAGHDICPHFEMCDEGNEST